ncbi:MAG: tetratricopeptide repeat protein [Rhodocyclaceae bacterium]
MNPSKADKKVDPVKSPKEAALAALKRNDPSGAIAICNQALRRTKNNADIMQVLAVSLLSKGEIDLAEQTVLKARTLDPLNAEVHLAHGLILRARGLNEAALSAYDSAVAMDPNSALARLNRANVLNDLGCLKEAVEEYAQALAIDDGLPGAHLNHGVALQKLDRHEEAEVSIRAALGYQPGMLDALFALGNSLGALARPAEAQECYEAVMAVEPEYEQCRWNSGLTQLILEQFRSGWASYEVRIGSSSNFKFQPKDGEVLWQGESLTGRSIVLLAEQGLGDTLQFCRFADRLVALGATAIILEVPESLCSLLQCLQSDHMQVCSKGSERATADFYLPLMSLPHRLGFDAVPEAAQSYLVADPVKIAHWQATLPARRARKRIGVVWSGSPGHTHDVYRSIPFEWLAPWFELEEIEWICLQKQIRAEERDALANSTVKEFSADLHDMSDTAALIANLDLVVSVDTSVAHLAAALGKPTWVLVAYSPDWRWLLNRSDSSWYPSVRLFRQEKRGDWRGVVGAVRTALPEVL